MSRSFGGSSRGGMGGGIRGSGGGGGGMLRTVQRAVRAGVAGSQPEPFSHATDTNTSTGANTPRNTRHSYKKKQSAYTLSSGNNSNVSSTFSSLLNLPVSATPNAATAACSSSACNDESEWECVDSSEDEKGHVFSDDFVFGTVPSRDEVQHAVSALQQVFSSASFSSFGKEKLGQDLEKDEINSPIGYKQKLSSTDSELDWVEPSLHLFNSRKSQPHGADRVYDALHLLQTEPSVQKMVISLSSDKTVWDAILNNEVVRELRGSLYQEPAAKNLTETSPDGSGDSNPAKDILNWIFRNTKAKIMQLIEKITELLNELFEPREREKSKGLTDPLEEMLKTSFFLSIMVLLVVVMARSQSA